MCAAAGIGGAAAAVREDGARELVDVRTVASETGFFGGNQDAVTVLEAIAGQPAELLRFVRRPIPVEPLLPALLDTNPEQVSRFAVRYSSGLPVPPVVLAGQLLPDGNHRVRAAARIGRRHVDAFVLLLPAR